MILALFAALLSAPFLLYRKAILVPATARLGKVFSALQWVVIAGALWPYALAIGGYCLSLIAGCETSPTALDPKGCVLLGSDISQLVREMVAYGWAILMTGPAALLASVALAIVFLLLRYRIKRRETLTHHSGDV